MSRRRGAVTARQNYNRIYPNKWRARGIAREANFTTLGGGGMKNRKKKRGRKFSLRIYSILTANNTHTHTPYYVLGDVLKYFVSADEVSPRVHLYLSFTIYMCVHTSIVHPAVYSRSYLDRPVCTHTHTIRHSLRYCRVRFYFGLFSERRLVFFFFFN